ncbi:MAG TPA: putative Ig domain-containing protein, partial [Azonexus sp.]|nr:putative Ig domain-containing protein [Azonexus sp.]
MSTVITIVAPSPSAASQLADALSNPMNAWDVANAGNNTVEVALNEDTDAALELLAQIISAQPQYIALGIEGPLAESLKRTAGLLRNRGHQIDAAVDAAVNGNYNTSTSAVQRFGDPLTLDLNGNGIETVPLKRPPLLFDINDTGIKISTGWIAPSDGLLVLDRNGNGVIDSGAELFGDRTPAYGSTGVTADGFAALAQEDTNHDGVVNSADANFANLRVWQDLNQDGISQANELSTLDVAGIASFNTARTLNSQMLPSGNQMADLGTFTRTDGTTGATGAPQAMADINLALDTFHRTFADTIPTTAQTDALPDMQGSGLVRDMRQAASLQTAAGQAFATALANFSAAGTREEQLAQLDTLLANWADTAEFGTQQSRAAAHGYTYTTNLGAEWQRKLTTLEVFNGRGFFKMPWDSASIVQTGLQGLRIGGYAGGVWNPKLISGTFWGAQLNPLGQAYDALRDSVYQALLPQTRLKPYLDAIGLTLDANGNFQLDFGAVQSAFDAQAGGNPGKAVGDLIEFNRYGQTLFAGTAWETQGWEALGAMLRNTAITPDIRATLAEFNVMVDGQGAFLSSGSGHAGGTSGGIQMGLSMDLTGTQRDDVLIAKDGGSTMDGGYGNDVLWGGNGNDTLGGGWGSDSLQGGRGNDILRGDTGNDTYFYQRGDGADTIVDSGWFANNILRFGAGITAADLIPRYDSASEHAMIDLGNGDMIDIGPVSSLAIQTLKFADGSTLSVGSLFATQMLEQVGSETGDILTGSNSLQFGDRLMGLGGDDVLQGLAGNDTLDGGVGNDVLDGGAGNDILQGGAGSDVLVGGAGSDTYIYNRGDGADTINDSGEPGIYYASSWDYYYRNGERRDFVSNVLDFGAGIGADTITPRYDSASNTITIDLGSGDSINIGEVDALSIQTLRFADGSEVSLKTLLGQHELVVDGTNVADVLVGADVKNLKDRINGGAGDDTLIGNGGDDILAGGAGNDVLDGGSGRDTYVFNLGDGADTILDNSWEANVLALGTGITAGMIVPRLNGTTGDVRLDFGGGDSVLVGRYNTAQSSLSLFIGTVGFADGSKVDLRQFLDQSGFLVEGNAADENLIGAMSQQNRMSGLDGNDVLVGGQRDDTLDGGMGNDTLNANYGDDVLTGGTGDDFLSGGEGSDVYVYNMGDGTDVVFDAMREAQVNTIRLGGGADVQSIEYRGGATGDLVLHFADGGSLRIAGITADNAAVTCPVQRFELADGSVLTAQQLLSQFSVDVIGADAPWWDWWTNANDTLYGTNLNDNMQGLGGDDVLVGGGGNDLENGGTGNDTLSGDAGDDTLQGGDGNDVLYGREGNDVLQGDMGDDILLGGTGNDTYLFSVGAGMDRIADNAGTDVLRFGPGIAQADLSFGKAGVGLRIALPNGMDAVVLENWFAGGSTVNSLQFDDGTTFDLSGIAQSVADQPVVGTAANETLVGSIYNDTLEGGQGNDILIGGTGEDVYRLNAGDGVDQIYELSSMAAVKGGDTLEFGSGITAQMLNLSLRVISQDRNWNPPVFPDPNADMMFGDRQRQVMDIRIGSQGDAIQVMSGKGAIEKFRFADGSEYSWQELFALQGGGSVSDSNDSAWTYDYTIWNGSAWVLQSQTYGPHRVLDGTGLAATFDGGVGDDTMLGGMQNDTYVFNAGDGKDVIADFGGVDEIAFGSGITAQDLVWQYDPAAATPFVLNVGANGDSISILDGEMGVIERFSFSDGAVLTFADLLARQGGLVLQAPSDVGRDFAGWNSNLIVGTNGADTISDGGDANFIVGGGGDDVINLGSNSDTVLFRQGDGQDTVNVDSYADASTLVFGPDVDPASVKIELLRSLDPAGAEVHDMRIAYGNLGDSVTVLGAMPGNYASESPSDAPRIRIEFADGTAWSYADLLARAQNTIVADPNNSVLLGTPGNDTFSISDLSSEHTIIDAAGPGNSNSVELSWAYSATQLDVVTYEDAPFSMVASENSKAPFTLSMVGGSLSVQFDNGVILNIDGFDPADPQGTCAIRNFKFSDGTVLGIDQVLSAGIDIMGTESTDIVHGTAVSDRIDGLSGDDTIMGGKGNDVLRGGTGNDSYVFNRGDGADTIEDVSFYWDRQQLVIENNVLRLGAGIDMAAVAVKFDPEIGKVYLDAGGGDSICIGEPGNFSVQTIQFADGTVWDEWAITDRMTIGAILKPDSGITYSANLADGSALPGWLSFDPSTGTFSGTPANGDVGSISVTVTATGSMGQLLSSTFLLDVLNVNDAPVVVASLDNQTAMEGNAFSFALPGQPVTSPFPGDATDAGTPDRVWTNFSKWMYGTGVNDAYAFARGDGNVYIDDWDNSPFDVVQLAAGISPSDITVTQDDSSLVLSINGTGDSLTLGSWLWSDSWKVEQVVFADGTVWGVNDLMAMAPLTPSTANDWLTGTAGNDTIHGLAGDDYVQSAEGNDTVIGGAGHDSLRAGIGDDTVHAGSGNDWIEGDGGSDILLGGDGMDDIYADSNYSDTANDLLDGGAGDDYLESSIANDLIIGGQGNDFLSADDGNDVILFNRGDGVDTLNSYSTNEGPVGQRADTISLGGGIEYADLSFSRDWNNLILNTGNGESITFRNWFDTLWLDNKNISTLQMMAEGMVGYDSTSTDPLLNKRIQQFDFVGLANQFEAELAIDQTITTWQLAPHLGSFYLGGSDVAAIGGDMAYLYGKSGNLDGLTVAEVRTQLSDSAFGTASQALTKLSMGAGSIVFGDEDIIHGDRLTFSATLSDGSPLPAWLTFEATTGTFSGTPGSGDAGILNVAVTATDTGGLSATTNFVLTVTSNGQLNVAPLASADTASVSEDTAQATIAAADLLANDTDPDVGDTLTLTGFDAVSALGNTVSQDVAGDLVLDIGDLYQSLGAGQTASDSFTYTASDAAGLTSTASVDVTIIGVNDAPVVAVPIAGQQSNEDSPFSFTVPTGTFTDIDNGDVLTYSATLADGTALPNWLSFDAATGTFSGTPDNLNVGNLNVLVTATDTGGLSASSAFSLHVANVNDTSTANADTGAATEDGGAVLLDAAILLSNDTDPDFIHGDVLSIVGVSQAASGAAVSLMNGAVQYDAGALFQSLGQGQTATDTFSYTVSDMAGATSTATVTMTITGVNDGPVTANDAAAVLEDAALVATGNVLANDTDVDQGTVLSVTNAGMLQGSYGSLVLNADGSYLYTLDNASAVVQGLMAGQSVTETFAYQATDGIAITPATLTVSINGANDAPVVASLITGQQTNEDAPFSFTVPVVTFTDIDNGDVLTYSATLSDGRVLPGWLTFDAATQTFSGTPGNWDVGNYSVTVTATDTGGLSASSTFAVDVANVNDVPTMNMALLDQGTLQDAAFSFSVPAGTFNDVDFIHRDVLTYSATMADGTALPSWLTFDAATQTFSGTPGNWDVGNYSVTVTATDTGGLSVSSTFAVDVANVNDAPTVNMALLDQGTLQDTAFSFTVPAGTFNDVDFIHGDTLSYRATMADGTALPSWLIFDAATQTFGGTPGNWDVGSYSVTVTATDTGGLSASSTFAIDVANVNDAPTVSMTLADQATLQDAAFSFTVPAGAFNDVDFIHGDTLSYSATLADGTALPSWLTFDATTQTFSGTPGNGDVGSLSVVVMATDTGGLGASSAFNLNVANINDAPTVSVALLDQGTLQDTAFSFTVPAGTFNDVDFIHGDTLSYSATLADGTALPSWLTFDAATATFSGTPANGDVGKLN